MTALPDRNPNPPERYQTPDSDYDRMTLEAAEAVAEAAVAGWEDLAALYFPEAARAQLVICVEDFYRKLDGRLREMFGRMDGVEQFHERGVWLEMQDELAAEARYFGRGGE